MRVERGDGWEVTTRPTAPALRGIAGAPRGYRERAAGPVDRREVPHPGVVLVVNLGDPLVVDGAAHGSFVAGLAGGPTRTEHRGVQEGIELRLSPLGAHRVFGLPLDELADRAVALEDLWGPRGRELPERLAGAAGWAARFAILDGVLAEAAARGPRPDAEVARAWRRLVATRGGVAVGDLAADVGWSRGRLAQRFRRQVGVTPKTAAGILRFDHAVQRLAGPGPRSLAAVALACGYYDQAHLNRDVRRFAGCSPTAYLAARRPDLLGLAFVQDGP